MPLAFESISHGTIAFGFFNIESDMLLLDRYFFFAEEFCRCLTVIAEKTPQLPCETGWEGYGILDPEDVGDLMGAIHGIRHSGFIGEVYRRFPFPDRPEDFRQNPEGARTREEVETIIKRFGTPIQVILSVAPEGDWVSLGPYRFTRRVFQDLIGYVWQGGYRRCKYEVSPDYVVTVKEGIGLSLCAIFSGLKLLP